MIVYVILLIFIVALIRGIVQGFTQYSKAPKPPKGLSYNEYYSYYKNREWEVNGAACDDDFDKDYFAHVSSVDGMNGHEFERFCADILRKIGYSNVRVTPGSGDQGVDILAEKSGIKYAIQCKNYASPLSNKPIQEVSAGKFFYNCHVGVVMTNSTFTSGARKLAEATGVLLWDGAELQKLMAAANIDLEAENQVTYKDFDEVVDEDELLSEIQKLINRSTDAIDPVEKAVDSFSEVTMVAARRHTPMTKELLRLGATAKTMALELNTNSEEIKLNALKIFGSLAKEGYNGWSTEESFIKGITDLCEYQERIIQILTQMKKVVDGLNNPSGYNSADFQSAKRESLHDIEKSIVAVQRANLRLRDIFKEHKKFKCENE